MISFVQRRTLGLLSYMAVFVLFGMVCTKDKSTGPGTTKTAPSVAVISPIQGVELESTVDSVTVKGVLTDADNVGIDSLWVNSNNVSIVSLTSDTFTTKTFVSADTFAVIAKIQATDSRTFSDTVTIYRKKAVDVAGMAKISGTLLKEATARSANRIQKRMVGRNAQGTQRVVDGVIPVSGADIMFYNADSLSTTSDTSVKSDSTGQWSCQMKPGNYFVFAVYFDVENFELVTSAMPDIEAEKDKETKTDSATAINDDIKPMMLTFLDASKETNGQFIASDIPQNLPIVMTFSEPMKRSAGDSVSGVVLGRVDADSGDLPLIDTVKVQKLWTPDGKELRLIPATALTVGQTYKVVIPSTLKDLATNKLSESYTGIFTVISAASLPDFAIKTTVPNSGDTIPAGFAVEVVFTRPIDMLSLNKNYTLTSTDTINTVKGYFEGKGRLARFMNTKAWSHGATYTLTIAASAKDLLGDSLATAKSMTFTIAAKDTFEQKQGVEGEVAAVVKQFMGAYMAGDIETFSQQFHANFECIETDPLGNSTRMQRDKFLEERREDIESRNRLSKYGFLAPVFYVLKAPDTSYHVYWKLIKGSNEVYFEDLGPGANVGKIPKVLNTSNADISSSVSFINRAIIYNGDTLYHAPDFNMAFIDEDSRENDPGFFGRILKNQTHVQTQDIMMDIKHALNLKSVSVVATGDTAQAMLELREEHRYLNGKLPFPKYPNDTVPDVEMFVMAIQAKLAKSAGKWWVMQMAAKNLFSGDKGKFSQDSIKHDDFKIQQFTQTKPIELVKPAHKSTKITAPITFKWTPPSDPAIKGYLFAISTAPVGGTQGMLAYTKRDSIVMNADGSIDTTCGATILNIDPSTLHVPIPPFSARITSLTVADSAIYAWKVIAVTDTSSNDISKNLFKVIADSDFGTTRGPGIFTMLDELLDIQVVHHHNNQDVVNQFSDRDGDRYPDWVEKAFGTSPDDPGQFPDFTMDSDQDGFPDFMEKFAGTNPDVKTSLPTDVNPKDNIADTLQGRPDWRPELARDDDQDKFPNEIEMINGTNPWDPNSKPGTKVKPVVPTGQYYGAYIFGDGTNKTMKKIYFSLTSDTTGDFANIDSTKVEGIVKNGTNVQVKLHFMFGEWVFYLQVVNGMNTGRYIKTRFTYTNNVLRGPVDIADTDGGGGPWIGNFVASKDSTFDFNNIDQNNNNNNNVVDPNNINLGPAPQEALVKPDSSFDLALTLTENNGRPLATLVANGVTIIDSFVYWSPGQWPAFDFKYQDANTRYHLNGNLHRQGMKGNNDSLVLWGFYEKEDLSGQEAMKFMKYDFTLILTNYQSELKPVGTWSGWYASKGPGPSKDPLPFIGDQAAVTAALTLTQNKAVLISKTGSILTITTTKREGDIWKAQVNDGAWYYILEKPGDWSSVYVKSVIAGTDTVQVVMLTNQGPGPMSIPFTGDSLTVANALTASSNVVEVQGNTPGPVQVDPATLHRNFDPNDPSKWCWSIKKLNDSTKNYTFSGQMNNTFQLLFINSKPAVFEVGGMPGMSMK